MNDIDHELRKRFAELREHDETNAPSYAAVRDRGHAGVVPLSERRSKRWIAPALLAGVAAVLASVWVATRTPSHDEPAVGEARLRDSSVNVIRWTMPTDGLLRSAVGTLKTPALFGSVLDAAAVPVQGTPFKGD